MPEVTVDFITKDPWQMVLVEEGPWEDVPASLRRLQERLYTCIDAAIDGKLAELYPDSLGANVVVRLDGYSLPMPDSREFFERFSSTVMDLPDYKAALETSRHVSGIQFVAFFK
ncbi:hypothetical protein [Roseateles violae]|uniref:Uncharacterized protein n=1 Tax=Roseateles violae TaxID=3058042 RepID=A0ABT8DYF6_9BURK|nr:hypothetical protein [Pelomonas sp. PFR6]MDN3922456.1 hypothetical protein [Pelomonas sp. PFR6]